MINYFRYLKEMRELKKKNLLYTTALLSKLYGFVDSFPDIVELAKKAKDLDINELQKLMAEKLVEWYISKEEAKQDVANNETTEE